MKTRDIVVGGLLTGLSIMIPLCIGRNASYGAHTSLFTATIAAHVPTLLAMAISPGVAAMVAIGSGIGFILKSVL